MKDFVKLYPFSIYVVAVLCNICLDPKLMSSSVPQSRLIASPFKVYKSKGLMHCQRHCALYSACKSFNYLINTQTCEMNSRTDGTVVSDIYSIFVILDDLSQELLGSCRNHSCPRDTICEEDDFGFQCVSIGCFETPSVRYINSSTFQRLWLYHETVLYPCEGGYYPSVDVVCAPDGGFNDFECSPFLFCGQLDKCLSDRENAEYWIFVQTLNDWVRLYCDGAVSFLTLNEYNMASTPPYTKNSKSCDEIPLDPATQPAVGKTEFQRVKFGVWKARIAASDLKHSNSSFTPQIYGSAGDCYASTDCGSIGRFLIDLNQTGLRVKSSMTWMSTDGGIMSSVNFTHGGVVVEGSCGRGEGTECGGCKPAGESVFLEIDPNYTPPVNSAKMVQCERRID